MLAIPSLGSGSSFVVIFPFFFGSGSPILTIALGLTFFVAMIFVMTVVARRAWSSPLSQEEASRAFVPAMGQCTVCGSRLPEKALFCPHCGSPVHNGNT